MTKEVTLKTIHSMLARIDSKLTTLLNRPKKETWVKVFFIQDLTGWDAQRLRKRKTFIKAMRRPTHEGGHNHQSTLNRYLKPYPTGKPPVFTYFDLYAIHEAHDLDIDEQMQFRRILFAVMSYLAARPRMKPDKVCASVNKHTGRISVVFKQGYYDKYPRPIKALPNSAKVYKNENEYYKDMIEATIKRTNECITSTGNILARTNKFIEEINELTLKKQSQNRLHKYLKPYKTMRSVPFFTYYDVERLKDDPSLCITEREAFAKMYLLLEDFIKYKTLDPSEPCAFVEYTTGNLSIWFQYADTDRSKMLISHRERNKYFKKIPKVECLNKEFIPYEVVCGVAFDHETNDEIATEFQAALIKAREMSKKWNADFNRFHYFLNPDTGDILVYFD